MAVDVLVPQMGESVLEGTILEWKVKVGDKVKPDQPLVELMTDKINIEIPSEAEGILTHQYAKEGDVVPVGTRIASIDDGGGAGAEAAKETEHLPQAEKAPKGTQATEPGVTEPPPTKKEQPAPVATAAPPKPKPSVEGTAPAGKGKLSPKVRMMIREYSLDPSTIVPTGKNGIVKVEDVERAIEERSEAQGYTAAPIPAPSMPEAAQTGPRPEVHKPAAEAAVPAEPKVKVEVPRFQPLPESQRERREPIVGIRKSISEHMVRSVQTSPHVTTFEDLDLTDLANYRNEIKADFKATYGANITFMPFIIKAVCVGLKEYPKLNASMTQQEIIYKNYYNIGVAVAREEGLIVPVIKDADKKTIIELAVELAQLGEKARRNRLVPDDVSGGTFSVTNAGMFGATASTPIINQPQVAILGVHAIAKKPWVVDGEITIRDISTFGLSFDHRLIDGHTAVQFLHRVHELLADPKKLALFLR